MTCNNYTPRTLANMYHYCDVGHPKFSYLVFGEEVGPIGTPHLQCYAEFTDKISNKQWEKIMGQSFHMIERNGTPEQASGYCRKGNETIEKDERPGYEKFHPEGCYGQGYVGARWGELKAPGKRTDVAKRCAQIASGEITAEGVALEDPQFYHQYGRTLHKVEDIMMRKKFRTWMTQGEWYYGEAGIGKSHIAHEDFDPETHYIWKNSKWQDGYTGQPIVIMNEFRGSWMAYDELLSLVDKWPHYVERRGREPFPFLAEKVIITSVLRPEEAYPNRHEKDSLAQLYRRFTFHEVAQRCPEGNNTSSGQ